MNITEANRYISALNRIAEGTTMLAQAIEETAWDGIEDHVGMPGMQPIAAAQLAQPALEEAANEYELPTKLSTRSPLQSPFLLRSRSR